MLKLLKSLLSKASKANPEPIRDDELLARFVFSKNHINASGVKPAAFMPPPNLKYSVFRKSRMLPMEYLNTRTKVVTQRTLSGNSGSYKGTALIGVSAIHKNRLAVHPDESDHAWHADIVGWPDSGEDAKSRTKELAMMLALAAHVEH